MPVERNIRASGTVISGHRFALPAALVAILLTAIPARAQQQTFRLFGYVNGRAVSVKSQPSWIDGGYGRFGSGANSRGSRRNLGEASTQIGAEWTPSRYFDVHVQGLGRTAARGGRGRSAGLLEAYVDGRAFLGPTDEIQLRAGQFFLPTSRENKEELWASPYAITWSALNSWIAEEVRPVGLDLQWKHGFYVSGGVTAFRDNDTMGALLAWRGWSSGNRLSLFDEVVPLPPLKGLVSGPFSQLQRRDGTTPFKHDLDGRTGFAERLRFNLPERANIQFTHLDTRGDRRLHEREYSWDTKYDQVSAEAGDTESTIVAAEYMRGRTAMGPPNGAHVNVSFSSGYLLLSHKSGGWRGTVRGERFSTTDRVNLLASKYSERGHIWTTAILYDVNRHARAALELTRISGRRPGVAQSGGDPDAGGRSAAFEMRYKF